MGEENVLTKNEKEALIEELNNHEVIEKTVSLSWDGTNLLLRIPKEIAEYIGANKDNRFRKSLMFRIEESEKGVTQEFKLVDRKNEKK